MSQSRTPTGTDTLERTRYFLRQIVTPPDLALDGEYLLHKLRRHHRLLHGWGIVLGLTVETIPPEGTNDATKRTRKQFEEAHDMPDDVDPTCGNWLVVTPGYAISPRGDELYLPGSVFVNTMEEVDYALVVKPAACTTHANPRTVKRTGDFFLIVEGVESEARPVRAAGSRCGDHPDHFEFSRFRDDLRFRLVDAVQPEPYKSPLAKLKGDVTFDFVVLTKVKLKDGKLDTPALTPDPHSVWKPAVPA
jgi:hypothetical protein